MPDIDKTISVIPIGTEVRLGPAREIRGHVISVSVRYSRVSYEVAWWSGTDRHLEWLEEFEVEPAAPYQKQLVGFQHGG